MMNPTLIYSELAEIIRKTSNNYSFVGDLNNLEQGIHEFTKALQSSFTGNTISTAYKLVPEELDLRLPTYPLEENLGEIIYKIGLNTGDGASESGFVDFLCFYQNNDATEEVEIRSLIAAVYSWGGTKSEDLAGLSGSELRMGYESKLECEIPLF
jgi:hypothetical protein